MVKSLYGDFVTAITTKSFTADLNRVSKDDCLSPLLFNLLIISFIQDIKTPELSQHGYHFFNKYFQARHWHQFSEEDAAVTGRDNQKLLNIFSIWCTWCDMIIHVGNCHSFGIRKVNGKAKQIKP